MTKTGSSVQVPRRYVIKAVFHHHYLPRQILFFLTQDLNQVQTRRTYKKTKFNNNESFIPIKALPTA